MFVVPKGVAHKPYAENEVKLLLIEPCGVVNTGDEGGERTAENNVWINRCRVPVSSCVRYGLVKTRTLRFGISPRATSHLVVCGRASWSCVIS